jgi:hypothetical protein
MMKKCVPAKNTSVPFSDILAQIRKMRADRAFGSVTFKVRNGKVTHAEVSKLFEVEDDAG